MSEFILSDEEIDACFNKWAIETQGNVSKKLGNTFSQAIAQTQVGKLIKWLEKYKEFTTHEGLPEIGTVVFYVPLVEWQTLLKELE